MEKNSSDTPSINLHLGDCVEGLRSTVLADSIDLVVTSPPYNLGIKYSHYQDGHKRSDYLDWCDAWADELHRVLKSEGSFFLNVGSSPSNPWLPHELILRLRDRFALQNTIHWIKSISIDTDDGVLSKGHFKPIQSPRFLNDCHEFVFHLTKSGSVPVDRKAVGVPYADKSNVNRWGHTGGEDRRCRGNNWFIPYQTIQRRADERPHPATFPVELAENCIRLHGADASSTMLDPFLGLGSAAIAAQRQGVGKFVGFEIDEQYLALARSRLTSDRSQGSLFDLADHSSTSSS